MSGSKTGIRYGERKMVNLYRQNTIALWEKAHDRIQAKYDADDAAEGEIAAQAWAEFLDERGPLE